MDKTAQARRQAAELISLIKSRFLRGDGQLARQFPPGERSLLDNFDDLAPFFLYFNEADFLCGQVRAVRKAGDDMVSICSNHGVLLTRNLAEWLGGLHAVWRATRDQETLALLTESVDFILRHVIDGDFLPAALHVRRKSRVPYYEPWSGDVLEVFCEMRQEFPEAFERAQKIMGTWIEADYFRRYGLFPYRVYRSGLKQWLDENLFSARMPEPLSAEPPWEFGGRWFLKNAKRRLQFLTISGWYSQLMKSNSTPAFTFQTFFEVTRNPLWKQASLAWCENSQRAFCEDGHVSMDFFPTSGLRRAPSVTPAFILADVYCDAVRLGLGGDGLLSAARKILEVQWAQRLPNGLVPYEEGGLLAHIDSQVDLSVSLRRYAAVSGDRRFLTQARDLMERALVVHGTPEGFLTFSGVGTRPVIDPKYNALVLKGLINLLTLEDALTEPLHDLLKDR